MSLEIRLKNIENGQRAQSERSVHFVTFFGMNKPDSISYSGFPHDKKLIDFVLSFYKPVRPSAIIFNVKKTLKIIEARTSIIYADIDEL